MKAAVGISIEYFLGGCALLGAGGAFVWLAFAVGKENHRVLYYTFMVLAWFFGTPSFFVFSEAISAWTGYLLETTYRCPRCGDNLSLWVIEMHKSFDCPKCGAHFSRFGRLFRSKNVKMVFDD